jgi:putative Holliday junction resolvase
MITRNPADLPKTGKLLAFDYGKARIGLAASDSAQRLAAQRAPLTAAGLAAALVALKAENPVGAVVGLPRNMDGSEGPAAQAAMSFAGNVAKALGVPVLLWDERLTSRQAEGAYFEQRRGRQTRGSKKDSGGKTDSAAAMLTLQSVLDARR